MPMMLTVEKSIEIIEAVARAPQGVGTRALARELGMNVTTVHNIASTLKHHGYLKQDADTKHFLPGLRMMLLGRHNSFLELLVQVGRPFVQRAAESLDESTMLATLDGGHVVNLIYVPSSQALRVHENQDISAQAYCIACGKMLLAEMHPQARRAYVSEIKLQPFTPRTIVNKDALLKELEKIARRRFALTQDEAAEGISAAAVPVADPWGTTIAALGASAPTLRFARKGYQENSLKVLGKIARELTEALSAS